MLNAIPKCSKLKIPNWENDNECFQKLKIYFDFLFLLENGYVVLGCSTDSPSRHVKFIEKHDLPFSLISDEDKKVVEDYGVWGLKKFMGKEYMGINRTTFIIDENGVIKDIIEKVVTEVEKKVSELEN